MTQERLQKVLARAGVASRRHAEELIREGRVTVNGRVAELGVAVDPAADAIKVDGKRLRVPREHRYLLVHKPVGVVSTRSDPEGRPTVLELLPVGLRKALAPVGRLDFDSQGLLLLTDDGDLAQRVTHPRYGCTKVYQVKVKGEPAPDQLERLRRGVVIEGKRTAPAVIERTGAIRGARAATASSWVTVELAEGRTRQIREMFFRIGHPVMRLRRVAIGPISDPALPPGGVRELTDEELSALEVAVGRRAATRPPRPAGRGPRGARPERPSAPRQRKPRTAGPRNTEPRSTGPRKAEPRRTGPRNTAPRSLEEPPETAPGRRPRGAPASPRSRSGPSRRPASPASSDRPPRRSNPPSRPSPGRRSRRTGEGAAPGAPPGRPRKRLAAPGARPAPRREEGPARGPQRPRRGGALPAAPAGRSGPSRGTPKGRGAPGKKGAGPGRGAPPRGSGGRGGRRR